MQKIILLVSFLVSVVTINAQQEYAIQYMNFKSQGQELRMSYFYEKPAAGANGLTVILLHGKNFHNIYWNNTISYLLGKGYAVLAPDQIGFGNASMPVQYQFSFHQLAANTKRLLDTLRIKNTIVLGHSIGGMLAIRFALLYPANCKQLILEAPIGLEDWRITVPYLSIDGHYEKEKNQTKEGLKKYMLENYFHNQWKKEYDSLLSISSKNLGNNNFAWCMALTSDMLYTQPVYYELKYLKMPVLLIAGALDKTAPGKDRADKQTAALLGNYQKLSKEAAQVIPNCKLALLPGIGHIPHIENFPLFTETLNKFLITK